MALCSVVTVKGSAWIAGCGRPQLGRATKARKLFLLFIVFRFALEKILDLASCGSSPRASCCWGCRSRVGVRGWCIEQVLLVGPTISVTISSIPCATSCAHLSPPTRVTRDVRPCHIAVSTDLVRFPLLQLRSVEVTIRSMR